MSRKEYNGLTVKFVPIMGTDIVAESVCDVISVQYYVGAAGWEQCETEEGDGNPDEGYSYNWNRRPKFD